MIPHVKTVFVITFTVRELQFYLSIYNFRLARFHICFLLQPVCHCQNCSCVCSTDVFIAFTFFFSSLSHLCQIPSGAVQALERQKEFSDAIRNERDELRDEVVQLKDILKVLICVVKQGLTLFS